MENNPTPYQRQRRAGRIDALPEEQSAMQPQAVPAPQSAQPVQPVRPVQPMQPVQYAHPPVPQPRSDAPAPASQGLTPTHHSQSRPVQQPVGWQNAPGWNAPAIPPQPVQQPHPQQPAPHPQAEQPVLSSHDRQAATGTPVRQAAPAAQPRPYAVPSAQRPPVQRQAAPRPRPAADRPLAMSDDPALRRAAAQAKRRQNEAARQPRRDAPAQERRRSERRDEHPAQQQKKVPSWLMTVLSLSLILVMGLVAVGFLMQAYLKTAADERQAAYEAILFNYHVTEQDDGSLRVTWQDTIEKYAAYYNLEPAFVTAVIRNESSFRTDAVSSVGARGLMQMMPDTAEWVAGKLRDPYDFDKLFDAETSIRYGCWYLNYLSELFQGDPVLVCAAYHAGQGEVWGWLGDPTISPDGVTVPLDNIPIRNTRTYAGRVTQAYGIYQTLLYPGDASPSQTAAEPGGGAAADLVLSAAAR